ncbi:MAG: hypothetical protein IJ629_00655 [Clostridia bacterium]|nr:hypothetical protein [Clostridia bacterium]
MRKHLKALLGFPVGIAMLVVSYVIVYLIDGQSTYLLELGRLEDIKVLVAQSLYSALAYVVLFEAMILFTAFTKRYSKNITWGAMLKFIIGVFVFCLILPLIDLVLGTKNVMDGEVGTVLIGTEIIVMILVAVVYCIVHSIEEVKINKALKEKNDNNK